MTTQRQQNWKSNTKRGLKCFARYLCYNGLIKMTVCCSIIITTNFVRAESVYLTAYNQDDSSSSANIASSDDGYFSNKSLPTITDLVTNVPVESEAKKEKSIEENTIGQVSDFQVASELYDNNATTNPVIVALNTVDETTDAVQIQSKQNNADTSKVPPIDISHYAEESPQDNTTVNGEQVLPNNDSNSKVSPEEIDKTTDKGDNLPTQLSRESEKPELREGSVVEENLQESLNGDEDSRLLFPNLRPFKRARQRLLNARSFVAPPPPNIDVEETDKTVPSEPVLTKEDLNLPPLGLDESGVQEVATKSELEKLREETKDFAWQKGDLKIVPYGFLNLSISSDSQRAVPGDFILYAQSPDIDDSADFALDPKTSRLGFKIDGPRVDQLSADLGGQVEFDFQGLPNGSKNKAGLQLRRAFIELNDDIHQRRFLAGQDWEIISPVAPEMLNYLPAGFAGDLQYRRAQFRIDQGWKCSSDLDFIGQLAVCDNILADYLSTSGATPNSSGWPILEMRVGTSLFENARDGLPIKMGISGHIGEQYYKFSPIANVPIAATSERVPIRTWSTNFDMELPLTQKHKIQGEYYFGSNLSSFCGGINQGVDLYRRKGIRDTGGWLSFHSGWSEKLSTNIGYALDKPNNNDLVGTSLVSNGFTTSRTRNEIYFVNCIYKWTSHLMTGLETSYVQTKYKKADVSGAQPVFLPMATGKTCRIEFVTRLSF